MGIKEQFQKACDKINSSAKKVSDSVKNEYRKNQLKNELDEIYLTLGKVRYTELTEGTENTEESGKLFEEITRIRSELETLEGEEKKEQICAVCGRELSEDVVFCPYCGTKKNDINDEASSEEGEEKTEE